VSQQDAEFYAPGKALKEPVMLRFKPKDAVFILPKYTHLYPGPSAVVTRVIEDPFRPALNEYVVGFPDGSSASLFEFQIIEDMLNFRTFVASLVFDSHEHPEPQGARGLPSNRHIILQTPGFHVAMSIHATKSRASTMGQILERGTKNLLKGLEVRLMKESLLITSTMSDSLGTFKFSNTPRGLLNILVVIPQHCSRILGEFLI
jgi:hypothetical protein